MVFPTQSKSDFDSPSWRNAAGYDTYYAYDASGSCERIFTPNGTTYFAYSAANLVKSIAVQDAASNPTVAYDYTADLQRYQVTHNGVAYYQYHTGSKLTAVNGNSLPFAYHNHGPSTSGVDGVGDLIWTYNRTDFSLYPLMDHRGSVVSLRLYTRAQQASQEYDAFGRVLSSSGTWRTEQGGRYQSNWQYIGFDRPSANGASASAPIYLTPAGPYDAETGRFLYRDPIGSERDPDGLAGLNLYTAFNNDPVNKVDPEGKYAIILLAAGLALVAAAASWFVIQKKDTEEASFFPESEYSRTCIDNDVIISPQNESWVCDFRICNARISKIATTTWDNAFSEVTCEPIKCTIKYRPITANHYSPPTNIRHINLKVVVSNAGHYNKFSSSLSKEHKNCNKYYNNILDVLKRNTAYPTASESELIGSDQYSRNLARIIILEDYWT